MLCPCRPPLVRSFPLLTRLCNVWNRPRRPKKFSSSCSIASCPIPVRYSISGPIPCRPGPAPFPVRVPSPSLTDRSAAHSAQIAEAGAAQVFDGHHPRQCGHQHSGLAGVWRAGLRRGTNCVHWQNHTDTLLLGWTITRGNTRHRKVIDSFRYKNLQMARR